MLLFCVLLHLLHPYGGFAQQPDTSFLLPAQTVSATKKAALVEHHDMLSIDSVTLLLYGNENIAQLLADVSFTAIKNYGPGSLSTIALRGLGSQQTMVSWNGFSIQNPMNGIADLSLVNLLMTEGIEISFAKQSIFNIGETIGGNINLYNKPDYESGFRVKTSSGMGSFGNFSQGVQVGFGNAAIFTRIKTHVGQAENNFPFTNPVLPGKPTVQLQHAALKQYGAMYELYGKWNKQQEAGLAVWYENSSRQIPAPVTAGTSAALQDDASLRVAAHWNYRGAKAEVQVKSGWFAEKLYYSDSLSGISSDNKAQTWFNTAETVFTRNKSFQFTVGCTNRLQTAKADAYGQQRQQNLASVYAQYNKQFFGNKINFSAGMRQSMVNLSFTPLTAQANIGVTIYPWLVLHVSGSKNYRLPTFNDLYWQPGGNTQLKPENGWAQQAGITISKKGKAIEGTVLATVHNNLVTNWIQWLPTPENNALWQPVNHSKVWAKGAELGLNGLYSANNLLLRVRSAANYQLINKIQETGATGQFIYVPCYTWQNSLHIGVRKTALQLQANYFGKRYTTTDNSRFLPPYWLVNAGVLQQVDIHKIRITVRGRVNNLLNKYYETIEYRPMPGINYEISATLELQYFPKCLY